MQIIGFSSKKLVLTALLAGVIATTVGATEETALAAHVRALNGEIVRLHAEVRRTGAGNKGSPIAITKAERTLRARARAMRNLILTNPAEAASLALPADVLKDLARIFPNSAAKLEQRGRWQGELEHSVQDYDELNLSREHFRLHLGKQAMQVMFVGREPPGMTSGRKVAVSGVRVGDAVAVEQVEALDGAYGTAATTTTTTTTSTTTTSTCGTTGPQKILTVLVNMPSYSLPSTVTAGFMRGVLLGNAAGGGQNSPDWSLTDFWKKNSDSKTWVDSVNSSVVGPIKVNSNYNRNSSGATYCDYYGLQDAVLKSLDSQVDFRKYARIQVIMPNNGACSWSGMANIGCRSLSTAGDGTFTASMAWERGDKILTRDRGVQVSSHELGHTLGLRHSASRDFASLALGSVGTKGSISEYGDLYSAMGTMSFGFYSASQAANQLGWLTASTNYRTIETSGTYVVSNYEALGGAMRALKVRRGTGNNAWIWIEKRQNTGLYSSQLNPAVFSGALMHYQDSYTTEGANLLDFTPNSTASFTDAPLPLGGTWQDPYSDVSISVNGITTGSMTVSVNYAGATCTRRAPTVSATPTSASVKYGGSTQFTLTVTNTSSNTCAAETFSLARTLPSGWSGTYTPTSISLAPGMQATAVIKVTVPSPYMLGTYATTFKATSAATAKSASIIRNVTVVSL